MLVGAIEKRNAATRPTMADDARSKAALALEKARRRSTSISSMVETAKTSVEQQDEAGQREAGDQPGEL
jgi:hypothetical protein